jgi:leader peptidase (prepilin peptidase) / N-methyltransferase
MTVPYTKPIRRSQTARLTKKDSDSSSMPAGLDAWIVSLADAVAIVLLVALGANLGSFLNVVVHRLPRGESVVTGGSRCPACGVKIRWHDNVPVFGWLMLRGRCRDCGGPISSRYPLVEAAAAVLVGSVASVELLSGGRNLPGEIFAGRRPGLDGLLLDPDWSLVAVCAVHCAVLVTLLAWALIDHDGHPVPWRWAAITTALAVVAAAALPGVQPVGAGFGPAVGLPSSTVASAAGIAVGWLVGQILGGRAAASMLILLGAALGWQAAMTVTVLAIAFAGLRRLLSAVWPAVRFDRAWTLDIVSAAVAHELAWRLIHQAGALWHGV